MKDYDKKILTESQKNANKKQWYKDTIDNLNSNRSIFRASHDELSEYRRMKVNYDLYNNILNREDFEYVCQPFGAEVGELPADMTNKDISSTRIKSLLGMAMKRGSKYKLIATNREATTRIETAQFDMVKEFVNAEIMRPIIEKIQMKAQEQAQGQELTKEQQEEIQAQIAQEIQAQTPDSIKRYMERDHQDPAEVFGNHILKQVSKEINLPDVFNKGMLHALLSAYEVYYIGTENNKTVCKAINPMRFDFDKSSDVDFIEDGENAVCEYRMTPSEIIKKFGHELSDKEIDDIYKSYKYHSTTIQESRMFDFSVNDIYEEDNTAIPVIHVVWKAPRKIGFLSFMDENGELQMDLVAENYRLDMSIGDVSIEWRWIPQIYEGWKVQDLYLGLGQINGLNVNIDNVYEQKLPYYGTVYDSLNSNPTSIMDRMKYYQYYHNIVMYRLELLLASDDGKKLLMNINAIPEGAGIDIEQWQYFFKSTNIGWFNPNEEGVNYNDINSMAKQIDMSLASDINKYIQLAEYLDKKCGQSVGVTDPVLGQISPSQEVGNTRQQLIQTSHILEPYFNLHNEVKRRVTNDIVNITKALWSISPPDYINYVLDDLSRQLLKVDSLLLENSKFGLFVENSIRADEIRETIKGLAHAAMQTGKAELSDVISIIRQDSIQESEEILLVAEKKRKAEEQQEAQAQRESAAKLQQSAQDWELKKIDKAHSNKMDEIEAKGAIDLQKQAMLSAGFNTNKDVDNDGKLDILEIYNDGVDADIKAKKVEIDKMMAEETIRSNKAKEVIENKKLKQKK